MLKLVLLASYDCCVEGHFVVCEGSGLVGEDVLDLPKFLIENSVFGQRSPVLGGAEDEFIEVDEVALG